MAQLSFWAECWASEPVEWRSPLRRKVCFPETVYGPTNPWVTIAFVSSISLDKKRTIDLPFCVFQSIVVDGRYSAHVPKPVPLQAKPRIKNRIIGQRLDLGFGKRILKWSLPCIFGNLPSFYFKCFWSLKHGGLLQHLAWSSNMQSSQICQNFTTN